MIQIVRETGRRLKVYPSERLHDHFVSLARSVAAWRQQSTFTEEGIAIGITSVEAKAGCSVVAVNLAAALAGIGRCNVLLVETQFGSPGISRRVPRPGHGLGEILQGKANPADCICNTNVDGLFVLGCGRLKSRAAMELPFENLEPLNVELSDAFRYIVYDLPISNEMTHCYPMIQHTDGVLLVNSRSDINEEKINRTVRRLRDLSRPVIGMVLNRA